MSLYHKIKRTVKLGVAVAAVYYCARTCNAAIGQEQINYEPRGTIDELVTKRDSVRTMDYQLIR